MGVIGGEVRGGGVGGRRLVNSLASALLLVFVSLALADGLSYFVGHSKYVLPNSNYTLSVSLFKAKGPVQLKVSLLTDQDESKAKIIAKTSVTAQPGGNPTLIVLPIKVALPNPDYWVKVCGSEGLKFCELKQVRVLQKGASIFIQTDRLYYQPGQKVLFRILAVNSTLMPITNPLDVFIYDCDHNRIMQWLNVKPIRGVYSNELLLSNHTCIGEWSIEVRTPIMKPVSKKFLVIAYERPRFDVVVVLPSFHVLSVPQPVIAKVIAKYHTGLPVRGTAVIEIDAVVVASFLSFSLTSITKRVTLVNGEALIEIDVNKMIVGGGHSVIPPPDSEIDRVVVFVSADVREALTGATISASDSVNCYWERYRLKFSADTPISFRPGLPFNGCLELKQKDGSDPLLSDIQTPDNRFRKIGVAAWSHVPTCPELSMNKTVLLNPTGRLCFQFDFNFNCSINLKASFYDITTNSTQSASMSVAPFVSFSRRAIQVSLLKPDLIVHPENKVVFNIKANMPIVSYNYMILSRGSIVKTSFVDKVKTKSHQLTIPIDRQLARLLAPVPRIVVWFVANDNEIVSDSCEFRVDGLFANDVSLHFEKNEVSPGENVSLIVRGSPNSLAYVLAVDKSALILGNRNDITQKEVLYDLLSYTPRVDPVRDLNPLWDWELIFSFFSGPQMPKLELSSADVFENALVVFMTDGSVKNETVRIDELKDLGLPDEPNKKHMRRDLRDTWMWKPVEIGSNGEARIEDLAPDTITSWVASAFALSDKDGLGIAPVPAQIVASKPFSIEVLLPFCAKQRDSVILRVLVFNYLDEKKTVSVTLKASTLFDVKDSSKLLKNTDVTKSVEVPRNDSAVVVFTLIMTTKGEEIPVEVVAVSGTLEDAQRKVIRVYDEGFEMEYSKSVLIENLNGQGRPVTKTVDISLPPHQRIVPGSVHVEVTVTGDVLATKLDELHDRIMSAPKFQFLLTGLMAMGALATNDQILNYFRETKTMTPGTEAKLKYHVLEEYQTLMTTRRDDGSFQFLPDVEFGSVTWSALAVDVIHKAKDDVPMDEEKMAETLKWIISHQNSSGAFNEILTNSSDSSPDEPNLVDIDLTSVVVLALMQNRDNSVIDKDLLKDSIAKAVEFLEVSLEEPLLNLSPGSLCVVAYALVVAESPKADLAIAKRDKMAIVTDDMKHWEEPSFDLPDSLRPPYRRASPGDIVFTATALLTYVAKNDLEGALPLVRWLVSQRSRNMEFIFILDTILGVEALAEFAKLTRQDRRPFNVRVNAKIGKDVHSFVPIKDTNAMIVQIWEPVSNNESVVISASGPGLAVVQIYVRYNIYELAESRDLSLKVDAREQDCCHLIVTACASWNRTEDDGVWLNRLAIVAVLLPPNFHFVKYESDNSSAEKIVGVRADFTESIASAYVLLDNSPTCIDFDLIGFGDDWIGISSTVVLMQYYNPYNKVGATYEVFPADCGSQFPCESDKCVILPK